MSNIDEKALQKAYNKHIKENGCSITAFKFGIKAYEATKEAGQPVGMTFDEWVNSLPTEDLLKPSTLRICWNAAIANKRKSIGAANQIKRIKYILANEDTYDECVRKIEDVLAYQNQF